MNRKLAALALGAVVLAGACSNNDGGSAAVDPTLAPSTTADDQALLDRLPTDSKVVAVKVITPANPNAPIDVKTLPQQVQGMAQFKSGTPEQQRCVGNTVKATLDADPSIVQTNGKVASMMGQAMAMCGPSVVGDALANAFKSFGLTDEQTACLKREIESNKTVAGMLMSTLLTADLPNIMKALEPYAKKCGFDVSKLGG